MSETTEHLTTGWEPDTPASDTIVRSFLDAHAESLVSPVREMGGRVHASDALWAADSGRHLAFYNSAVLRRPLEGVTDAALDEVDDFFLGGNGSGSVYLWSATPTPDLGERGWALCGHPPLLVRPPGDLPPAPADLDIARVGDATGIDDWSRVAVEGYPVPEVQPYDSGCFFDERVLNDPAYKYFTGYSGSDPVTASALYLTDDLAVLALGVTTGAARGKGYWYGMVRKRLELAGDRMAAAIFSDMSRPGAEKLGFIPIVRFTLWERHRSRP